MRTSGVGEEEEEGDKRLIIEETSPALNLTREADSICGSITSGLRGQNRGLMRNQRGIVSPLKNNY